MHDEILDNIVANAFNGLGDITGSDDFGGSFAWIDLADFVENYGYPVGQRDSDELSAEFIEYNGGHRYGIAYITDYGNRGVLPFDTKDEMMRDFRNIEAAYREFEDNCCEDEGE